MKQYLQCLIIVVVIAGSLSFLSKPDIHIQNEPHRSPVRALTVSAATTTPVVQPKPAAPAAVAAPSQQIVAASGDNTYMDYIFSHESSHNLYAREPTTGACGLGQAYPCSKLTSVCDLSDQDCQTRFFTSYAVNRYGSWAGAYQFWVNNHWW